MIKNRKILICVCGGIASYKVVEVVSRLKKMEADVTVMMTESAMKFVTPLTFRSISLNKVYHDLFEDEIDIKHIVLGQQSDLIVIVPATANVIGKLANGIADDLVTTTLMASDKPRILIPAMNTVMFENEATQDNLNHLVKRGYDLMMPESGTMAMKAEGSGIGRLPEPTSIVEKIQSYFSN